MKIHTYNDILICEVISMEAIQIITILHSA